MSVEKELLLKFVLVLIKSVIILLFYLVFDKKHRIERNPAEYVAIFVFCDLYVLYSVVKALKSKVDTSSRLLIIILSVLLITNYANNTITNLNYKLNAESASSVETEVKYYDRMGLDYSSLEELVYYTVDGAEFIYDFNDDEYVCIVNTSDNKYDLRYDSFYTYVDENGWIVFTDSFLDYDKSKGDFGFYDEKTQKYYANIRAIRWNKDGTVYWDY